MAKTSIEIRNDEIKKELTQLRNGTPIYAYEKDKIGGLIDELQKDEVFIVVGNATQTVTLRMGVASYKY